MNHKTPIMTCLALTLFANILYGYLQSINTPKFSPKYWMLLARIIMGVGACKYKLKGKN
jgi:hypothetical protein